MKFSTISSIENGVILTIKNNEVRLVLFSELKKIYIEKRKFNFLNKMILISVLLILTVFLIYYLPTEMVLVASMLYIPLIVKMETYKSYQLHLQLNDRTVFFKAINANKKQEYKKMVTAMTKEIFDNHTKCKI
jgi:cellulose synthase/poly-beta-1,6-N-acetylglucosamine synthase-like glycosyltransferase